MADKPGRMRRLPPLTAIRAFEAAGRFGIQRAAAELNVTPAAIYHQIRALEADLEVELFTRNKGKGLVLTLQGEQYLSEVIQIFDNLYASVKRIRSDGYRNELTIDSLTSFASGFLIPRIKGFIDANPDIDVKIITPQKSTGRIRFEQTGAHVAIRGGAAAAQWPDLHAEMLVHETMFPVCAPELLEGPDGLKEPADLARARILDVVPTPEGWADWLEEAERRGHDVTVNLDDAVKFDLIQLSMQAAAEGLGVDLGRAPVVDHLLDTGRLVAPFDIKMRSTLSYWLVAPEPFTHTEQFRRFRAWLRTELAASRHIDEDLSELED